MSAWSGVGSAAVVLVLALLVAGQPMWEWRLTGPTETELWSYGLFGVQHTIENATTGQVVTDESFTYYDLPNQPRMSALFIDFARWVVLSALVALGGLGLSVATATRKLRGLPAGLTFLGGCVMMLYVSVNFVFAIPTAAGDLPNPNGQPIPDFRGQFLFTQGGSSMTLTWGPLAAWFLALGMGLALAWSASEMWHIRVAKKTGIVRQPSPTTVVRRVEAVPPPPPIDVDQGTPQEPDIEEVFVIAPSGLLVKHLSKSLLSDKDRDVVGGMISVVSNFVREAFTEKDGEVQEIQLGEHRFVMYNERGFLIAVVVGRGDTEHILHRLRHLAACLVDRYGTRLLEWDGEPLEGMEDELGVLWEPFFVPPPPVI